MNIAAMQMPVQTSVAAQGMAASADADDVRVATLSHWLEPIAPSMPVLAVGDRFLQSEASPWLSLPIVENGKPVGSVSRYDLMQRVYIKPFGRELYGKRAIGQIMQPQPLVLAADATIEEAGRYVSARMRAPITEDFIVIDEKGRYIGAGKVLDLLGALERRVSAHSTELENAYRRLQTSQGQLVQSEKMASLGQMVAGIAHEMNTPLGYIRNNVEMTRAMLVEVRDALSAYAQLVDGLVMGAPQTDLEAALLDVERHRDAVAPDSLDDLGNMLDDTAFGVDQIAELVASLKDFSRQDGQQVERMDVHRLIENALKIGTSVLRKKNIEVDRQFGELPRIRCAPNQINQVLLNLITNAAQAIEHDHGRLIVRTHASSHFVLVAIEDNGNGIEPEHVKRIFDPFYTTKPVGHGTGLGLSICYQIIERHGGRIRVSSAPGKGARFTIALPLRSDSESAPEKDESDV